MMWPPHADSILFWCLSVDYQFWWIPCECELVRLCTFNETLWKFAMKPKCSSWYSVCVCVYGMNLKLEVAVENVTDGLSKLNLCQVEWCTRDRVREWKVNVCVCENERDDPMNGHVPFQMDHTSGNINIKINYSNNGNVSLVVFYSSLYSYIQCCHFFPIVLISHNRQQAHNVRISFESMQRVVSAS